MPPEPKEEAAPLFGTWRRWYLVVLLSQAVLVLLFAVLTHYYEPR